MSTVIAKYEKLALFIIGDNISESSANSTKRSIKRTEGHREYISTKYAKLDFPRFDNDDPSGWIYKCKRFYHFYAIEEDDGIYVASIYIEGRALDWFQEYETSKPKITWKGFIKDLILRFSPGRYDDPISQLTKLRQSGTVQQYQEQFEALVVKTHVLSEEFYVSCFASGLCEELRNEVLLFETTTLVQAMSLTCM
ncbi:hypothetical protein WN943_010314 [Citrus x changshan-huyou]